MDYTDINAQTIDRWIAEGWEWGMPITHEEYEDALKGEWNISLTPTRCVPKQWFPDLKGCKVLGLAAGGAQQMPVLSALGAKCTVLDYSKKQLESEWMVSKREGYDIEIVHADMAKPLPFPDMSFNLIVHPVSNHYIRDVEPLWFECARVIKRGGLMMAGFQNGINYLFWEDETRITQHLPFDPLINPGQMELLKKEDHGIQFSHTIEEQIGGQLRAGFELLDIYEDTNGDGELKKRGVPGYYATLARKK